MGNIRRAFFGVATLLAVLAGVLSLTGTAQAFVTDAGLPSTPRTDTPRFIGGTVTDQTVVGDLVIVVGEFEQVRDNDGTLINQKYLAAYDIDSGALNRSYNPVFDAHLEAIEPDGHGGVIVGGLFDRVDDTIRRKLARLDANGNLDTSFRATTSARVTALAVNGDRVYAGGPFVAPTSALAAFHLSNGALDTNFDFPIEGPAGRGGDLSVKALDFAGDNLVVAHHGRTIAGEPRIGAAIIDTTPLSSPSLLPWNTNFYKESTTDAGVELALTNMAVSPDGTYFVIVSSGGDAPLRGRDAAVRFPVNGGNDVEPTWISRHFDSLFGIGISDQAVFIGGHFLFQEAPGSIDPFPGDANVNYGAGTQGQGPALLGDQVVARRQIGALDPTTGKSLNWNPGASAQIGVESLVVIDRGLLVGQDGDVLGGQDIGRHGFFDIEDATGAAELTAIVDSHFNGQTVDAGEVTISGRATDGAAGVDRVQLAVVRRGGGSQYLQADGTLGRWVGLNADLDNPDATATSWSRNLTFTEAGEYRIQIRTFTVDGRRDLNPPYVDLVVRPNEDELPVVSTTSVSVSPDGLVTATGVATDDRGVRSVTIAIDDPVTHEILQPDGSLAVNEFHRFEATLSAVDSPATTWTYTFRLPRNGTFRLEASVVDTADQDDERFALSSFVIALDDAAPTITLADGDITVEPGQPFLVNPTVADDFGLEQARIRIRRDITLEGPRRDGTVGTPGVWIALTGVGNQVSATPEFTSPGLPAGSYTLQINASDLTGQQTTITRRLHAGALNDSAPEVRVNGNRFVNESEQDIVLTGTAADDLDVAAVQVFIRDVTNSRWIDQDGNRVAAAVAHLATLDSPNATDSTWSFNWLADSEATYDFTVIAVDSAGQSSQADDTIRHYLPSNSLADLGLISPADRDVIDGSRISISGRAIDDIEVDRVRVQIRREADRLWLAPDGSYLAPVQSNQALLSNPGRPGTNWNFLTPDLEPGTYLVRLDVRDDTGRDNRTTLRLTVTG